jgi:hypothetical protein
MVRGKARRLLALIEASLEILHQVQPATMEDTGTLRVSASSGVKHPTRRGLPVDPRRAGNHTAGDRDTPAVSIWSASPVTRKLARLGIRPIRQALRQGEAAGRLYDPLEWFRWGLKRVGSGRQDGEQRSGAWRRREF